MTLIEEIEAAANRAYRGIGDEDLDVIMLDLTICKIWPRIKAALEAGQEMDKFIEWIHLRNDDRVNDAVRDALAAQAKFRAANLAQTGH